MVSATREGPLYPYRVLDLTNESGVLCTKFLADLGADVIIVEPPGGHPMRRLGPFYKDDPNPEKSLFWFALNTNKRSITLDITRAEGQGILRRLVRRAHFLVECFPPGYLNKLGLGYAHLSRLNRRLVYTSVTPFGQSGPYRDYQASDIVAMAMGGLMWQIGDPDRPPVRPGASHAYAQAGVNAAVGSLVAHYHRERTGEGQHVDISMQEAVLQTPFIMPLSWELTRYIIKRRGPGTNSGWPTGFVKNIHPCKDGFIMASLAGPDASAYLAWLEEEGVGGDLRQRFQEAQWGGPGGRFFTPQFREYVDSYVEKNFFTHKTRQELYEGAMARRLRWHPVNTPSELLEDKHLGARGYWVRLEHPELGAVITYPGAAALLSESPLQVKRRAPFMGEHNGEVYCRELGLSPKKLATLKDAGII